MSIVALSGVAIWYANTKLNQGKIDEATLCHMGGAKNVTAILLDLTDPLNSVQAARLRTILNSEIKRSSVDTMLSIGIVSESAQNWGVKFAKCKPASGETASSLYENPAQIAKLYKEKFTAPLGATLSAMMTGEVEDRSPIMEGLQALIAETPDFTTADGTRKVLVVSDMLQHSDALSFYRGQDWDYFVQSDGAGRLAGNLSAVDVEILLIPRSGVNIPTRAFSDDFWARYLDVQGANRPNLRILGDL